MAILNSLVLIKGHVLNPVSDKYCQHFPSGAIIFQEDHHWPIIHYVGDFVGAKRWLASHKLPYKFIDRSEFFIMPPFVDLHFHWVQDQVREMPKDSLLDWLENYTWPLEAKFKDKNFAKNSAENFKQELLQNGTLAGACYGSIHSHSVEMAFKNFVGHYKVGNVLMTMNSPDYLIQTQKNAKSLVERLSKKYGEKYAMTPRFAPTTHPDVMKHCALIANKNNSYIQTHLSENVEEIKYVLGLFKKIKGFERVPTYTHIYDRCGLLGPRTIMGHGIHLHDSEWRLLARKRTIIAHCPTSNAPISKRGLGSGLFNYKKAEKFKVRWGLGSDIGAGPLLSMFDVINSFVWQNKKENSASFTKGLYRATVEPAKLLGQSEHFCGLRKGAMANFLVVSKRSLKKSAEDEKLLEASFKKTESKRVEYAKMVLETYYRGQCEYSVF